MDDDQKREVYNVARRAVHDELRALVIDIAGTIFGLYILYVGISIFVNSPLNQPFFSPMRIAGIGVGLFGLLMIGIVWKWDQWLHRHLPISS